MADIQQPSDDHVMGIGPSQGVYRPTGFDPGYREVPLNKQTWLGNNWWGSSPSKKVSCQGCGKTANVSVKWSDAWLCHKCNPDIRQ